MLREKAVDARKYSDEDLAAPWKEITEMGEKQTELGCKHLKESIVPAIQEHVHSIRSKHRVAISGPDFTAKPIQERQDILRRISLEFQNFVKHPPEGLNLLTFLTKEAALQALHSYCERSDPFVIVN